MIGMPGHILCAKCACGFERELSPGASTAELYVIAYTADADDLVTIESRKAAMSNLAVIEDPWLKMQESDPFAIPSFDSSWGPYQCPGCSKESLHLWPRGHWD
jgi:hypothetical protein